ncbi:MAG: hypothetical protein ACLRWA_06350 [Lachnospira sp.]
MKILRNQLTVTGTWNSSFTGEVTDGLAYGGAFVKGKRLTRRAVYFTSLQTGRIRPGL